MKAVLPKVLKTLHYNRAKSGVRSMGYLFAVAE